MKSRYLITTAAIALALATTRGGAQKASFDEVETVVAVEIPVQVLVDNQPVAGLKQENFEVLEGRKSRPIVGFDAVNLTIAASESDRPTAINPEVPAAGRRHFLLLFDLTNSEPTAITRVRAAARRLVESSLHPSDLVAVGTWSFTNGPRMILGFTTDRRQVDVAIDTLGIADVRNRSPDLLNLQLAEMQSPGAAASPAPAPGNGLGAEKDAIFLENLKEFAATERASTRQVAKDEVASFTHGVVSLAQLMGAVGGRKYVVLLSQGFDSALITGASDPSGEAQTSQSVESGEIWNVNSEERFGSTRSAGQLEEMLGAFRRADCTIQAVDIGGLAASGASAGGSQRASGRDVLFTMANDTGGQLYENFNDLGSAMGKMLTATSITYVLTIQPSDLKLDGKFHEIKVRLVNGPSGAKLTHRIGYYAPRPFESRAAIERQLDTAQLLVAGTPGGDLAAGVTAAVFRGEGDRMDVPVVIEVEGASLIAASKGDALPVSVYLYAFDGGGSIIDLVAQNLQLDLKKIGGRLKQEPLKFIGDLRLPVGDYQLRSLVRAGPSGAYWLGQTALNVPAFAPGSLAVVAPLVPTPMTVGIVIRASSWAEKTKGLAFPFVMGTDFYLPSGLPTLRKDGNFKACLNVYGLDNADAKITGELVDEQGRAIPGVEVKVVGRMPSDQPGLQRFDLIVAPGSAPAGLYLLHVTVEQTGRSASSSSMVRVSS